ncbi:type VII secretion-associated serine protease mycosin [Streptomyces melanosporofaciens]|uniref:Type VII secretion-associated serine protease mycosin n=1 Tax=Streptomyces melanosporofaciens TaxID=67327 RepID=A0A1H4UKK0_STRMJ|nr:type VII secretion-associated serine protease mycosin [Streptomyces melanosporofaciens]SEC69422.1 type VII secretion-associated serine protease mycosin [Streptomyces melanosporofaciens]
MRRIIKPFALSAATALTALTVAAGAPPSPAAGPISPSTAPNPSLAGSGECSYPAKQIKGTPWSLQRVMLDQLWHDTKGLDPKGRPVKVAVIDTGVDNTNPQLKDAVDAKSGKEVRRAGKKGLSKGKKGDGTDDSVGHGTKVAGIIAARPHSGTGFVGIAPKAEIIPIRQNDEKGSGTTDTMATAIDWAVDAGARIINISQDTVKPLQANSNLQQSVEKALQADVVVVASAGNDGLDGKVKKTYPAAYDGVLAVGASDRNNERAAFSQSGDFVDVAAPGVEMVSTVPKGGQCVDNGTSFSAPYVAGVAALIRAKHPDWKQHEVVAQIEQTAERAVNDHDRFIGWGVVDPVRALTEDETRIDHVTLDKGAAHDVAAPDPAPMPLGETPEERRERLATYSVGAAAVMVAGIAGLAAVLNERRRRRSGVAE